MGIFFNTNFLINSHDPKTIQYKKILRENEVRKSMKAARVITPKKQLESIPKMVEKIVSSVEHLEFDRCHFHEFGDSSLLFDVVYFVDTREYITYIDTRQTFNLALFSQFEKDGIAFAYPTQTLFVKK